MFEMVNKDILYALQLKKKFGVIAYSYICLSTVNIVGESGYDTSRLLILILLKIRNIVHM